MRWCTCWRAGAARHDLGARDTRTYRGLPSHLGAFQAVENSRRYRSDNRPDTVQITGHSRSNLLEHKALAIGQLSTTVLYNATFTTVARLRWRTQAAG